MTNNSLIFFDKEGNPLNFNYNKNSERYEGDILFPENSSDTFKTQSLYLFEKVNSFEYENESALSLRKFQLFNEHGFHFYQGVATQSIYKIEPVNTETNYFSKWIYGKNIESKYKLGTFIRFTNPIFEFTDPNRIYSVVGSKKNAILIISSMNNGLFEDNYNGSYGLTSSYSNIDVVGVDIIGIYDYITPQLRDNLSLWNEPSFYDRLYEYRKLNIINTDKNDNYSESGRYDDVSLVTIKNPNIVDIIHFEYDLGSVPEDSVLIIEVATKTDLPLVYRGPIEFESSNSTLIFSDPIPDILKPGVEFKVPNSVSNSDTFFKVSGIDGFKGNVNLTYYATGSQVIWDNKIYQCIQSHTWSGASESAIYPTGYTSSELYWSTPTYLPIEQSSFSGGLVSETIVLSDIFLTTDHIYFTQSYTQSSEITLALTAERFKSELSLFNIDLYYKDYTLKADLVYPTKYAEVNYYYDQIGSSYSIGGVKYVYEKCIETYERLSKEFNYDYSSNWDYNIVFTDIDEFGIIIKINKMVYGERVAWIYSSGVVDMERTIDRTLRNWLTRHFLKLNTLGVVPTLVTVGYSSVYYNSIKLSTDFPNVPIEFSVQVGTTADYYIEHSVVYFYTIGKFISVSINGRTYEELFDTDVETTLSNWIDSWQETIDDFGVYVTNLASTLKFNVKKQKQRLDISVNVGKLTLPGIDNFKIIKKYSGNLGGLITSNEIILATSSGQSLENVGFATGQVVGINKTYYTLQNIEYNTLYLNPDIINLSYEGPFWGLTDSLCNSSAFTTVAFTIGFGQTGCPPSFTPSLLQGMYDKEQFDSAFSIEYLWSNTYTPYQYDGVSGMVDITYIQPANKIYVLGDKVRVFDSIYGELLTDIEISGLTNSIELCFNSVNNYLYALSKNILYKIDPYIDQLISTYSLISNAYSIALNKNNGDIYITSYDSYTFSIYDTTGNVTYVDTSSYTYNLAFNDFEGDVYVGGDNFVARIDGDARSLYSTYSIISSSHSICYDPENESIYVFEEGFYLKKIDNNTIIDLPSVSSSSFDSLIFNNFNSSMNSSTDLIFSSIFVDTDVLNYTSSPVGYGKMAINQFDGDIYIGSNSQLITIDSLSGQQKHSEPFSGGLLTKLVYNPDRRSIWAIQPQTEGVFEVKVNLSGHFDIDSSTFTSSNDNFYGTLDPDYIDRDYLWLNVREYIRRPRENFNGSPTVSLYWKWFSDNVPEFFMYDFSGEQLGDAGILSYSGPKPLETVVLNRKPNRDISKVGQSEYQQTIFDYIENNLDFIDDNEDVSVVPEPIQLFIGYNSKEEGALRSVLQLYKKEDVDFTITSTSTNDDILTFENIKDEFTGDRYGIIKFSENSSSFFTTDSDGNDRGLKVGQHLAIFIKDITNSKNQYISLNNGYLLKIRSVYGREIIVDYFKDVDSLEFEKTEVESFPKVGNTTYLSCRFKVWNKEIGRFNILGQTEIEDIRYHIELNNVGKIVSSDDVYIFKEYDIKEEGIDWNYLNLKRKEMLMMKNLIYPYIGSYKAIINAINYFGYNDLELYEYYRNIELNSDNYSKLFKVEIPDIFDNSVEGWVDNDFIKHTFPNANYEDTNLFNLTFRITDFEGNNLLYYTLEEVQKKLQGLKYWLQKNIIPISHKILDITGRADFSGVTTIVHQSYDAQILNVSQDFTPITFDLNEAYLLPVNSGSTVYNCVLDFYVGSNVQNLPDYYTIDIRTYEIYREWYAFRNYEIGERVTYYDRLYESVVNNNKTNNPRKFENAENWEYGSVYNIGDIIKYNRLFYVWSEQGGATFSIVSPNLDEGVGYNWFDVTDWKEIDLSPVDRISEHRLVDNLNPFNFTVDSNITPYIVVDVTSDNGYGMIYSDRKNFEIKGILDIQEIETFSNLTTKQYRDATLPVVYANIEKVSELTMLAYPFTKGFLDVNGYPTDSPYINQYGNLITPNIKNGYPYIIGNSSSFTTNSFRIEFGDDFGNIQNPYVISSIGYASVTGLELNWNGNLAPGATVSIEIRGDVTLGGKSNWRADLNTSNNQALVPLDYLVSAKLTSGTNYGITFSTSGSLSPQYYSIYNRVTSGLSSIRSYTQSFTDWTIYGGGGYVHEFEFATFSNNGVDIISGTLAGDSFESVVDAFNIELGSFGYVYYQNRVNGTNWDPSILFTTYYENLSINSYVNRYRDSILLETDTSSIDSTTLFLGTNSVYGAIVITQSYYPN